MRIRTVLFAFVSLLGFPAVAAQKPNILIIVSDDQDYADAGFQGSKQAVSYIPNPQRRKYLAQVSLLDDAIGAVTAVLSKTAQNIVNVTRAPYSAKRLGVSEDTTALQRALNEGALEVMRASNSRWRA